VYNSRKDALILNDICLELCSVLPLLNAMGAVIIYYTSLADEVSGFIC
jgi:hypothetical protein